MSYGKKNSNFGKVIGITQNFLQIWFNTAMQFFWVGKKNVFAAYLSKALPLSRNEFGAACQSNAEGRQLHFPHQ